MIIGMEDFEERLDAISRQLARADHHQDWRYATGAMLLAFDGLMEIMRQQQSVLESLSQHQAETYHRHTKSEV